MVTEIIEKYLNHIVRWPVNLSDHKIYEVGTYYIYILYMYIKQIRLNKNSKIIYISVSVLNDSVDYSGVGRRL